MQTFPLPALTIEQAKAMQFRLVDMIQRQFTGSEFLSTGDVGVVPGVGSPRYTRKVEAVLADFFGAEAAVLVRGAGTGAIRSVLEVTAKPGAAILVHSSPIYPTTETSFSAMGLQPVPVDFNEPLPKDLALPALALVQYSRQAPGDRYDVAKVIAGLRVARPDITIISDDNYVVMKVENIGVQLGASASTFSLFKLLGPAGIGCVVGSKELIAAIRKRQYSGGSQVQGHEAMEALRALTYAPVALAIQAGECEEILRRLDQGEVPGVKSATLANAQSRVVLIEFARPVAREVLARAEQLGCAPHPVGAESKYEVTAMFYRLSGTFAKARPGLEDSMIRVNPMRAGADTVIRVLNEVLSSIDR